MSIWSHKQARQARAPDILAVAANLEIELAALDQNAEAGERYLALESFKAKIASGRKEAYGIVYAAAEDFSVGEKAFRIATFIFAPFSDPSLRVRDSFIPVMKEFENSIKALQEKISVQQQTMLKDQFKELARSPHYEALYEIAEVQYVFNRASVREKILEDAPVIIEKSVPGPKNP